MDFLSPLRYPGGKAKLAPYIQKLLYSNNLCDGVYVEPYAGGASVALSLLFGELVDHVIINDKDRSIYSFWYSVINETDNLCRLISDTDVNIDEWHRQKLVQNNKDKEDLLSLGFSTFFLNRTNRSGILKAGVIGGLNQQGNYKIDARFKKQDLIKRILQIAEYSDRIELHNEDAVDFLNQIKDSLSDKSLLYLDPPYYVKGKGLYLNYYNDADHQKIADTMVKFNDAKWIITYDDIPYIEALYKDFRKSTFELNYSASNSGKGTELMIYSHNLKIPNGSVL